jgi:hypothetical protein
MAGLQVGESTVIDGAQGVDRAVLIRTSMGASRRFVKKRQILSQSLAVHPSIASVAAARVGVIGRGVLAEWHKSLNVARDQS